MRAWASTTCWRPAQRSCARRTTRSRGPSWPIPRAMSSVHSPHGDLGVAEPRGGMNPVRSIHLTSDVVSLTAALVDIASESLHEQEIADAVESSLRPLDHLDVVRDGHTIVARTNLGRSERVVIAGHVDTVPVNGNFPSRLEDGILHGLGSCDMKGGVAVALS